MATDRFFFSNTFHFYCNLFCYLLTYLFTYLFFYFLLCINVVDLLSIKKKKKKKRGSGINWLRWIKCFFHNSAVLPGCLLFVIVNLHCCIVRHSESYNTGFISFKPAGGFTCGKKITFGNCLRKINQSINQSMIN